MMHAKRLDIIFALFSLDAIFKCCIEIEGFRKVNSLDAILKCCKGIEVFRKVNSH